MTPSRTVMTALSAAVVALILTACAPQTPEDAFLSAVKGDDRITTENTDTELLELGNSFCDLKDSMSADQIQTIIDATAEELPEAGFVAEHADAKLCPDE